MKRLILLITTFTLVLGLSITTYAAPKKMADGQLFDAKFYAATYPDVAAACGSSEKALYNHYVKFGKAEGRLPYDQSDVANTQQAQEINNVPAQKVTFTDSFNGEKIVAHGEDVMGYERICMQSAIDNFHIDDIFETEANHQPHVYVVSGDYVCKFFEGRSGTPGQAVLWGIGHGNPLMWQGEPTPAIEGVHYWKIK